MRRRQLWTAKALREALEEGRLAVPGVPAQNNESDTAASNGGFEHVIKRRIDVGSAGEVGIEAPRLGVALRRSRVGTQQLHQPWDLVIGELEDLAGPLW